MFEKIKIMESKDLIIGVVLAIFVLLSSFSAYTYYNYQNVKSEKNVLQKDLDELKAGDNHEMDNKGSSKDGMNVENFPFEEINQQEKIDLLFAREEEKLARDVYITLYEKTGITAFNNIKNSEQTHTNTIKALLDKYSIEDIVKDDTVGVFENQELQKMYDDLVEQGSKSDAEALKVGATIEDVDIRDLQEFLERTDNEDVKTAYQNLIKGSRNHLRTFISLLEKEGETYTPQFISQEQYDNIISTPRESGQIDANGKKVAGGREGNGSGRR